MKRLFEKWNSINLVNRIIIGIIIGVILALTIPEAVSGITILGTLFVSALKAVAPILVFVLVINAIASHAGGKATNMKMILALYGVATFAAGFVAVIASFIFPTVLTLKTEAQDVAPPSGILEVFETLLFNIVTNPVSAIMNANYLGILAWAVVLGIALKAANDSTKSVMANFSDAITKVVQWIINLAPFGILGIVFEAISTTGLSALGNMLV